MKEIYTSIQEGSLIRNYDSEGNVISTLSVTGNSSLVGYTENSFSVEDSGGSVRVFNKDGHQISQINRASL